MKKTYLKDLPSVNKVLVELIGSVSIHDDFLKTLINRAINKYRNKIKNNQLSIKVIPYIRSWPIGGFMDKTLRLLFVFGLIFFSCEKKIFLCWENS